MWQHVKWKAWVPKGPGFQLSSSGLRAPAARVRGRCPRRSVQVCSDGEPCTDLTNGGREEARRGCPVMPWDEHLMDYGWQDRSQPPSPSSQKCTSLAFLGAGRWPTSHGPFSSWDIFPLLSWHILFQSPPGNGAQGTKCHQRKGIFTLCTSSLPATLKNWHLNSILSKEMHRTREARPPGMQNPALPHLFQHRY